MKSLLLLCTSLFLSGFLIAADNGTADVKAAARKLAEKTNYSWTSTLQWAGGPGGGGKPQPELTTGETDGAIMHLKMSPGDRVSEAFVKGDKVALKGDKGWQGGDELEGRRASEIRGLKRKKTPAQEAQDFAEKGRIPQTGR